MHIGFRITHTHTHHNTHAHIGEGVWKLLCTIIILCATAPTKTASMFPSSEALLSKVMKVTMAICTVLKAAEVIQPLVEGGYTHFWKKTNMIFNTFMSVTLDFCYEISFLCLSSLWHSQVSTKHFPQMLCNSLYFWQCQHRSNSSLGPGVCRLGLWPVSSLLRSIPMLGVFFFDMTCQDLGKCHAILEHFFFPPKFTRDLSNEWNQGCWW